MQAGGAIIDTGWQRSIYPHLDAFLSTTRSIPEIIQCCFGVDDGNREIRDWFDKLSPDEQDPYNAAQYDASTRVSDDVILTNVISFDVKAWDPNAPIVFGTIPGYATPTTYLPGDGVNTATGATGGNYLAALTALGTTTTIVGRGAYVDLNYQQLIANAYPSVFSGPGNPNSLLKFIYDTGCFSYEDDGIDQDGLYGPDQYVNGIDDNGIGGVDDVTELESPVPYPSPLKGIQVKIRVFEPDSRQIREITVVEDFLWE